MRSLTCPNCSDVFVISDESVGTQVQCKKCGARFWALPPETVEAPAVTGPADPPAAARGQIPLPPASAPVKVTVSDFDMPFRSMVGFMVKWALASIPALLILLLVGGIAFGVVAGLVAEIARG